MDADTTDGRGYAMDSYQSVSIRLNPCESVCSHRPNPIRPSVDGL